MNEDQNQEDQNQEGGTEIPITINVTDKRRVMVDGEAAASAEVESATTIPVDADPPPSLEELEGRLREAEEKRAEAERQARDLTDRFRSAQNQLRIEADEQRQRLQRNFEQRLETARGDIVTGLLDTLDNLQRAILAAEKSERHEADFDAFLDGVRATSQLFAAKMQSLGLVRVPSEGEDFNPELHEAVEMVQVGAELDNKVILEYQAGYRFGERLIRPARVRVGRAG
ncbi:MAG: nucleotide exchange factor GrpE [Acidobacteriota bacterium]|jgi:molecular chaperone GrpE